MVKPYFSQIFRLVIPWLLNYFVFILTYMSITSWHKKSSYGSFFNSTIGGLFFLLSIFMDLFNDDGTDFVRNLDFRHCSIQECIFDFHKNPSVLISRNGEIWYSCFEHSEKPTVQTEASVSVCSEPAQKAATLFTCVAGYRWAISDRVMRYLSAEIWSFHVTLKESLFTYLNCPLRPCNVLISR